MQVVLISEDEDDAARWMRRQPTLGDVAVVWVSPRSPHRARGVVADAVLVTDAAREGLTHAQYRALFEATVPRAAGIRS